MPSSLGTPSTPSGSARKRAVSSPRSPGRAGAKRDRAADGRAAHWAGHAVYPFERFSEDAKKTLTLAQEEAERSHHSYIGTEHLLLGVLRNQDGVGYKVLDRLGIHTADVRLRIESVLGRNPRIIIQQIVPTSR